MSGMGKVLVVVRVLPRVLPSDSDTDLDELLEKIKQSLSKDIIVSDSRKEEIGFGLQSLIIGFLVPEREGAGESLERYLASVDGVGEVDVQSVTRI